MVTSRQRLRRAAPVLLALVFGVAGITHFVAPEAYVESVPRGLPLRREIVYASGLSELVCAGLLLLPRTRRAGGLASAGLLVAVLPANVQTALDRGGAWWWRVPLQLPLVVWALAVARNSGREHESCSVRSSDNSDDSRRGGV